MSPRREPRGAPEPAGKEREEAPRESPREEERGRAPAEGPYFVTLRFGKMRLRGTFRTKDPSLAPGEWVQARTPRGVEPALVISRPRTRPLPVRGGVPQEDQEPAGTVLRRLRDFEVRPPWEESGRFSPAFYVGKEMIRELNLPMKLTDVEVLPRREKAVFYFLAEGRVDFRQLVRNLARALRIRVEMKQIGVRDEARLKGTCGHCGLPLCCAAWIRKMAPVNMKMAKTQKTTLDPDKISGRCGRLLCCLRFEEEVYRENRNSMPSRNSWVKTPEGPGKVVGHEVLMCRVKVALETGETQAFPVEDLRPGQPPRAPQAGSRGSGERERRTRPAKGAPPAPPGEGRPEKEASSGAQGPAKEGKKAASRRKPRRKRRPGQGRGARKRPGPPG